MRTIFIEGESAIKIRFKKFVAELALAVTAMTHWERDAEEDALDATAREDKRIQEDEKAAEDEKIEKIMKALPRFGVINSLDQEDGYDPRECKIVRRSVEGQEYAEVLDPEFGEGDKAVYYRDWPEMCESWLKKELATQKKAEEASMRQMQQDAWDSFPEEDCCWDAIVA